jgi:hypothetical protein
MKASMREQVEQYVLRWLGQVGRAHVGDQGRLEHAGRICHASPAAVLRLVQQGKVVAVRGELKLAKQEQEPERPVSIPSDHDHWVSVLR